MILIDVGANDGAWGLRMAQANPKCKVLAFEPVPHLCDAIEAKKPPQNYELVRAAVSETNGTATLHVSVGQAACSSLLPFRPKEELEKTWVGRRDLVEEATVEVRTTRLDTALVERGLDKEPIAFLHIDAQGFDLAALQSLGDLLNNVSVGEAEAVIEENESLYVGQDCTVSAVRAFLHSKGFRTATLPHLNFLEADIRFWRSPW